MKYLIFALLFLPSITLAQVGPVRWRVDANISGANPSLGTSAQSSYIGIEDGSLTLTNNSGTGTKVITAMIPCSGTNSPSGTTCSSGNESVGVSFTPPGGWKGDVKACAVFTHEGGPTTSNGNSFSVAFQLVETPNNAQTISQLGKERLVHRIHIEQASTIVLDAAPFRVCGTFTFATSGQKTLRLFYEQVIHAGTINSNIIYGDASASIGQRDIRWEVYPLNN